MDIKHCADLCELSYAPDSLPPGFHDVGYLRYGITAKDGTTYVTFRGTANPMNILRDLRVWPSRSHRGFLAHLGFMGGFRALLDHIPTPSGPTVFTGHSLGGAVALLFAEKYGMPVVTFGCPRVYFRWGQSPDTVAHIRYVCDDDPVPMIPRLMYRHLCSPVVLADNDRGIDIKDHSMSVYSKRLRKVLANESV